MRRHVAKIKYDILRAAGVRQRYLRRYRLWRRAGPLRPHREFCRIIFIYLVGQYRQHRLQASALFTFQRGGHSVFCCQRGFDFCLRYLKFKLAVCRRAALPLIVIGVRQRKGQFIFLGVHGFILPAVSAHVDDICRRRHLDQITEIILACRG